MTERFGSAKAGDKVRALGGISRDPDWQCLPNELRPQPDCLYTIADVGPCRCCGRESFLLKELPHMVIAHTDEGGSVFQSAKAEWFTTEGARLQ